MCVLPIGEFYRAVLMVFRFALNRRGSALASDNSSVTSFLRHRRSRKVAGVVVPSAVLLMATILISALAFLVPVPAYAATPACGSTITASTTLTANIGPCSGDGLNIGAD